MKIKMIDTMVGSGEHEEAIDNALAAAFREFIRNARNRRAYHAIVPAIARDRGFFTFEGAMFRVGGLDEIMFEIVQFHAQAKLQNKEKVVFFFYGDEEGVISGAGACCVALFGNTFEDVIEQLK